MRHKQTLFAAFFLVHSCARKWQILIPFRCKFNHPSNQKLLAFTAQGRIIKNSFVGEFIRVSIHINQLSRFIPFSPSDPFALNYKVNLLPTFLCGLDIFRVHQSPWTGLWSAIPSLAAAVSLKYIANILLYCYLFLFLLLLYLHFHAMRYSFQSNY